MSKPERYALIGWNALILCAAGWLTFEAFKAAIWAGLLFVLFLGLGVFIGVKTR